MGERKRIIKCTIDKQIKRPRLLCESNTVFASYSPERIKSEAGQYKMVQLKIDYLKVL